MPTALSTQSYTPVSTTVSEKVGHSALSFRYTGACLLHLPLFSYLSLGYFRISLYQAYMSLCDCYCFFKSAFIYEFVHMRQRSGCWGSGPSRFSGSAFPEQVTFKGVKIKVAHTAIENDYCMMIEFSRVNKSQNE